MTKKLEKRSRRSAEKPEAKKSAEFDAVMLQFKTNPYPASSADVNITTEVLSLTLFTDCGQEVSVRNSTEEFIMALPNQTPPVSTRSEL